MACARFLIEGRVQGVYFRASTRDQARRIGLAGYAKNLADGRVEVLAVGSAAALDELEAWLRHGPRLARVDRITRIEVGDANPSDDFQIF